MQSSANGSHSEIASGSKATGEDHEAESSKTSGKQSENANDRESSSGHSSESVNAQEGTGDAQDTKPPHRLRPPVLAYLGVGLGLALLVSLIIPSSGRIEGNEVEYSAVLSAAEQANTESVTIDEGASTIELTAKDGTKTWSHYPTGAGKDLAAEFQEKGATVEVTPLSRPGALSTLLMTLLPVALIIAFLFFLLRRSGGGLGLGGLKLGKRNNPVEVPATRFGDIAGADEAVSELQEAVDFLHNPERFTKTGAKPPRGFLLVGPPGTGKTLLARAVAGEAGVPFFALNGSDFVEMFVGVGAARVRELFEKARAAEKAIVFIDEIDAVGKARSKAVATGANDERESTLNQLLVEMDGFSKTPGLIMIAATNRADVLDPALLRPGRFDRKIYVPPPDRAGREALLKLYSAQRPFADVDWASIARRIPGMTGADIEQMLNEAALEAARQGSDTVSSDHVESALATTILGRERKSAVITERDRKIVAWHESGHTVAALLQANADDPVSVTIVPRGGAGGVTWLGGSEHDFMTRTQARARLVVAMAGRAAEEILLNGDHTQGAHGDLSSATSLATEMITRYGMGTRLAAVDPERISLNQNHDVEGEVSDMLQNALEVARQTLTDNKELLERIACELLEQETLDIGELKRLASEENIELPAKLHSS